MAMKLWYCTAEIAFVVAAEKRPGDWAVARFARDEAGDNSFDEAFAIREIKTAKDLPPRWDGDCCPQSDETTAKIGDILREIAAAKEREPLPGQMELPLGETP